jgi:DNA-binding transcriptional MerR regulator
VNAVSSLSSRLPTPGPQPAPPAQLALAEDLAPSPARGGPDLTIGEVLTALQADFPELTISKIRYYERQGLLRPARSAAGYRKFSPADVSRLHYILTAARDQYLPLKVIKERLEAADGTGGVPETVAGSSQESESPDPQGPPQGRPRNGLGTGLGTGLGIGPELFELETSDIRLTRRELMRDSGLDNDQLTELEAYGLIAPRGSSTTYEAEALVIARIVAELSAYGFQARHLRPVKAAVDREMGLIEQVLTALVRQSSREGRSRAESTAREYAALSVRLHVALLEAALRATLR